MSDSTQEGLFTWTDCMTLVTDMSEWTIFKFFLRISLFESES